MGGGGGGGVCLEKFEMCMMSGRLWRDAAIVLCAVFGVASGSTAGAQVIAPAERGGIGEMCETAILLPIPQLVPTFRIVDLAQWNNDPPFETPCAALPLASLIQDSWYRYVTARAGMLIVDSCGIGGGEDIRIEVWAGGTCPPDVLVACDDNSCGLDSRVAFPVGPDETYLIRFGGSSVAGMQGGGVFSSFGVRVAPFNDECDMPEPISGIGSFLLDTRNATDSVVLGDTNPTTRDLWYRWTALETRRFAVRTCTSIITRPTRLTVYADVPCADVQTAIVSDPDTGVCSPRSEVEFDAIAGMQYLIRAGENPDLAGAEGDTLSFTILPVGPTLELFVDPNSPGGDGSSWDRAFTALEPCIELVTSVSTIVPSVHVRVADGTIRPAQPSFLLPARNTTIEGGFAGFGAPNPFARDIFSTSISGDTLGNDGPGFANRADNLPGIFSVELPPDHSIAFDGVGFNDSGGPDGNASAISVFPSGVTEGVLSPSLSIRFCRFERNFGQDSFGSSNGAGVRIEDFEGGAAIDVLINNSAFVGNFADGAGGGLAIFGNHSVEISETVFWSNSVRDDDGAGLTRGGGLYAEQASLDIKGCDFFDNEVSSAISGERDAHGGGIAIANGATLRLSRSKLSTNRALGGVGAGLYVNSVSGTPVRIANTAAYLNRAIFGGAIHHNSSDDLELTNVLVRANEAQSGAALLIRNTDKQSNDVTLSHCTIFGNSNYGSTASAVLIDTPETQLTATNSVFWGNTNDAGNAGAAQQLSPLDRFTLFRSIITQPELVPGEGLSSADPRIVEGPYRPGADGVPGTADDLGVRNDRYLMLPRSGATDAGDASLRPLDALDLDADGNISEALPVDLNGSPRVVDDPFSPNDGQPFSLPFMDIGALERDPNNPALRFRTASGLFDEPTLWSPEGLPGSNDVAVIDGTTFTSLGIDAPRSVGQLIVSDGFVALNPQTPTIGGLTVLQQRPDAVLIGPWANSSATLELNEDLTVPSGGVRVGTAGLSTQAELQVIGNAVLEAPAGISVAGGALRLIDGGTAVSSAIDVGEEGSIAVDGFGFILGGVTNIGSLDFVTPFSALRGGIDLPARLELPNNYSQTSIVAGRARAGVLNMRVGGTNPGESDEFIVRGSLELGGTLNIELINGYSPPADAPPLTLITPMIGARDADDSPRGMIGRFEVVNMPGLAGGLFYRAIYDTSEGTVTLAVELLSRLIGLNPSDPEATPGTPRNAAVGDLNEDGFPDVAVVIPSAAPGQQGDLVILYNDTIDGNPFAGFTAGVQIPVGVEPVAVAIADFDGVNGNDIAVLNRGSTDITLLLNAGVLARGGPRPFNPTPRIPVGTRATDIATADLDGDARSDLAWVAVNDMSDGAVFFALNQGGVGAAWMGIGGSQTVVVEDEPTSIDPADVDDDKDLDLVVGARDASRVIIIPNRGSGGGALRGWSGFGSTMDVPAGDQPTSIDPADLDDDKDLDLVVANGATGRLAVVLNDGGMTFRPPGFTRVGEQPNSVVSLDLDGDTDLDVALLAAVEGERTLQLLRNDLTPDGQVVLTPVPAPNIGDSPLALLKDDMDRDADEDLVVISEETPIARGVPPTGGRVVVVISRPTCLADLDGDGTVGKDDVALILSNWGTEVLPGTFGDADRDGRVTLADIAAIILQWGEFCGR